MRGFRANGVDRPRSPTFRLSTASIRLATRPVSAPLGHGTMRHSQRSSTPMSRGLSPTSAAAAETPAAAYRKTGGKAPWTILEPNALKNADLPTDIDIVEGFLEGAVLRRLGTGERRDVSHAGACRRPARGAARNQRQPSAKRNGTARVARTGNLDSGGRRGRAQFRTRALRHRAATRSSVRGIRLAEIGRATFRRERHGILGVRTQRGTARKTSPIFPLRRQLPATSPVFRRACDSNHACAGHAQRRSIPDAGQRLRTGFDRRWSRSRPVCRAPGQRAHQAGTPSLRYEAPRCRAGRRACRGASASRCAQWRRARARDRRPAPRDQTRHPHRQRTRRDARQPGSPAPTARQKLPRAWSAFPLQNSTS